eukprot:gene1377-1580_t
MEVDILDPYDLIDPIGDAALESNNAVSVIKWLINKYGQDIGDYRNNDITALYENGDLEMIRIRIQDLQDHNYRSDQAWYRVSRSHPGPLRLELLATLMVGRISKYSNGTRVTSTSEYLSEKLVSQLLGRVCAETMSIQYDTMGGTHICDQGTMIALLFRYGNYDIINYLLDLMHKKQCINNMPLNMCILFAVKALLERPDGEYAVSMVESIRIRFPDHQLFREMGEGNLKSTTSYDQIFPTPGSQEAIVYLMDALADRWSFINYVNMDGTLNTQPLECFYRFGEFIFDQKLIRYKKDQRYYGQEIIKMIGVAVNQSMPTLIRHIIDHLGQFKLPIPDNHWTLYLHDYRFRNVKWLQTKELMGHTSLGKVRCSPHHSVAALKYMIQNGLLTDDLLDPRSLVPSPDIIDTIHQTLPDHWKEHSLQYFKEMLRSGSLDNSNLT